MVMSMWWNHIEEFFPTVYFIGKYILVKVLSNQDSATRMALKPVRVQILSLGMAA